MAEIKIIRGDITRMEVDVIVNAANAALSGGGGVDGAIHRAAGPGLRDACQQFKGCRPGQAVLTEGYTLPATYVIHAVGPVWDGGNKGEEELLASCYRIAMQLASERGCKDIAFPAISCGAYRFPIKKAAQIALKEVMDFFSGETTSIETVFFVLFDQKLLNAYNRAYQKIRDLM